jgi:hypothetical protein
MILSSHLLLKELTLLDPLPFPAVQIDIFGFPHIPMLAHQPLLEAALLDLHVHSADLQDE